MNTYVLITMDSCRYDSVAAVWDELKVLPQIGSLKKAHSFSTWTFPSHMNILSGRLPWVDDEEEELRFGSREYLTQLGLWEQRLGVPLDILIDEALDIRPTLRQLGYRTWAITSAGPLGPKTLFASLFDRYNYVGHDGPTFNRAVEILQDEDLSNTFLIINVWETHYPYFDGTDAADDPELPRFPSWRARMARGLHGPAQYASFEVTEQQLEAMRLRQQRSVQLVDQTMEELLDMLPRPAFVTITADHGDCLGESGQFLHGEAYDPAVLRVPMIEGPVP